MALDLLRDVLKEYRTDRTIPFGHYFDDEDVEQLLDEIEKLQSFVNEVADLDLMNATFGEWNDYTDSDIAAANDVIERARVLRKQAMGGDGG